MESKKRDFSDRVERVRTKIELYGNPDFESSYQYMLELGGEMSKSEYEVLYYKYQHVTTQVMVSEFSDWLSEGI